MQKKLIMIGMAVIFLLTSCGLPGGSSAKTEEPAPAPAQAEAPKEAPAAEAPAPAVEQPAPAAVEPTAEEAAPAGIDFRDDFDLPSDNWSEDYILTTQAPNADQIQTQPSEVQDGFLMWKIRDAETYIYKFATNETAEDVVIEAKWISKGQSANGIALVCRASEDKSSWYEARISAQGSWEILRYDKSIRDNDAYKNPFVSLKKGQAKLKLVKPAGDNITIFRCEGPKLTYEVNGTVLAETNNVDITGGGLVGLGVMSSNLLQAQIDFDYFSATAP